MPTYVVDGYVSAGYQFYANQVEVFPASDVGYTVPIDSPNDDGLVFPLPSNSSSSAVHRPSFGLGWTSRSYSNDVSPDRKILWIRVPGHL